MYTLRPQSPLEVALKPFSIHGSGHTVGCVFALVLGLAGPASANEVSNPDFDVDTAGWEDPFPDVDTEISWTDAENFSGAPGSGSLQLRNSIDAGVLDGPAQCIAAMPGRYAADARALIPSDQSVIPQAVFMLNYYATPDCSTGFLDRDEAFVITTGSWQLAEVEGVAPAGTQGIEVRLLSGNTDDPTFTTVYWDAIFVPEPAAPATAALAAVALLLVSSSRPRSC